jgi:pimeloyl-ACP methyl ester carboxylesterase
MKKSKMLILGLVMVLVGAIVASMVQNDYGSVKVKNIHIVSADGQTINATLFVPNNATASTPAPAIMNTHGYLNQNETQTAFNVEFSRRGYVVLAIDMSGHGYSDVLPGDLSRGASDALKYLATLPFVDKANITVQGHSMGGWSSVNATVANPNLVKTLIVVGSSQGSKKPEFPIGSEKIPVDAKYNFAVIFAKYDEFSMVNYGVDDASKFVSSPSLMEPFHTTEPVELGKVYGSFGDGTGRIAYQNNSTHPSEHESKDVVSKVLSIVSMASPAPHPIDTSNQIWPIKEGATALIFFGLIVFMLGVASKLLRSPYFIGITQEPKSHTPLKPITWIIVAVLVVAINALTMLPIQNWATSVVPANSVFKQLFVNAGAIWFLVVQVIFVILFIIWHMLRGKAEGRTLVSYGLYTDEKSTSFSWGYIVRAFLFSITTVGSSYVLLSLVQGFFHVDARWWVLTIRVENVERFYLFLTYLIPFIIVFLLSGLISFGWMKLKDFGSELKNMVIWSTANVGVNLLGIVIIVAIQLFTLYGTGTVAFGSHTYDQLLVIAAYGLIPLIAITSIFSTYLYRKTGSIYAGAFTAAIFVTWYLTSFQAIG